MTIYLQTHEWHLIYQYEPMGGVVHIDKTCFRTPWSTRLVMLMLQRDPATNWRWRLYFAAPDWVVGSKLRSFGCNQCVVYAAAARWSSRDPWRRNKLVAEWAPRYSLIDLRVQEWKWHMHLRVEQHEFKAMVADGSCKAYECRNRTMPGQLLCQPHRRQIGQLNEMYARTSSSFKGAD